MCVYFGIIFMDFMDNTDFETKQNTNDDCTDNVYGQKKKQTNKQTNKKNKQINLLGTSSSLR